MHDTTFLDRNEPITMDGLRDHFRAHDFSAQTSGYKFKNASSEKNQMYLKAKGIFRTSWNQQMKKLCKKGSLKNFSADAPIRCLEESEEKLVAGTVMEILGKEALAEQLMDQILTSMQEPINTEVEKYAQARGKMVQELTEEKVRQAVDAFADEFLSRMMKLLLQVQDVPKICKYLSQNGAHEDFDEDVYEHYNKISFYPTVISHVLKNSFYCGIITYHKEYVPDYLKQKKVKNYGEIEFTQVQSTHEPIVTVEEYERVQRIMEAKTNRMPYLNRGDQRGKKPRTTIWGKLLICECGRTFNMRRWERSDRYNGNAYQCYSSVETDSYESRKKKGLSLDGICRSPMIPEWRLQMMANLIFRKYLSQKDKVLALANSILEARIEDTEEIKNNDALIEAKKMELARLSKKLDSYVEMRSEGDISRELFRSKCAELEPRIKNLQEKIDKLTTANKPKEVVDYREKLTVLQYALEQYTCLDEGQNVPESVIEAFVTKIVVHPDSFDWYFRFDGDPKDPLRCKIEGKRRTTTKIVVAGANSPAIHTGNTGCYQGLISNCNSRLPNGKREFLGSMSGAFCLVSRFTASVPMAGASAKAEAVFYPTPVKLRI